jgi:hypothetical protein
VLDALTGLQGEVGRLREDFEVVGRHLGNARARWDDAARRLDRFEGRLADVSERAGELEARAGGPADPGEPATAGWLPDPPEQQRVDLVELLQAELVELVVDDRPVELPVAAFVVAVDGHHQERQDPPHRSPAP